MKHINLNEFAKHVSEAGPNRLSDVYMIVAKSDFERQMAVDLLVKVVLQHETSSELCLQVFDLEKQGFDLILSELKTLNLFAPKRVVVVHNIDKIDKGNVVKLEAYFAAPNCAICLIMTTPSINRATNLYKKAEKHGVVLDIGEEKPWEREKSLIEWLHAQAPLQGKQMDRMTCQLLIKQLGTDQFLLQQELFKLACYVGESKEITEKDVAAICGSMNNENGWQLGEAIFRRDSAAALRIGKALLNDGVAVIALLRQIRSQFQTEFNICSILMHGGSGQDIAREYPYMKGQILEKHIQNARSYGISRFKEGILKIDQAEMQAKNSSIDPDCLIEILLAKLTV